MTKLVLHVAHVLSTYFITATLNFYYNSYPPTEFPGWCFLFSWMQKSLLPFRCHSTVLTVGNLPNAF